MTPAGTLGAISHFLEGLAELSERTGVGIHASDPMALDAYGKRFAFSATCRNDGTFEYRLDLTTTQMEAT